MVWQVRTEFTFHEAIRMDLTLWRMTLGIRSLKKSSMVCRLVWSTARWW